MNYQKITKGTFIERPNRFIAKVLINGKEETVHVKNTGRCRELLVPDATVYLEDFEDRMGTRKLRYSLVAVEKNCKQNNHPLLINMDSQAPNALIKEEFYKWASKTGNSFRPETTYKNSRFDFSFETKSVKGFLEVKGVTLEKDGVCMFPDAPTERGTKHLTELIDAKQKDYWAGVLLLVQMSGMKYFTPNKLTDPKFSETLKLAKASGVEILCYECSVTPDSMTLGKKLQVVL